MFKGLSTALLQHIAAQNSWSAAMLKPHAGKHVQLNFSIFKLSLAILENGSLASAGETASPDAVISIKPSVLLRLLAKDESAKLQIKLDGDAQLAAEIAKVLAQMRWDYEEDISRVVGDVSAHTLGQFARNSAYAAKDSVRNMAAMLSEYWQEEQPLLAKKRHVEAFNAAVDTLRADVERLEKRIEKLRCKPAATSHPTPDI